MIVLLFLVHSCLAVRLSVVDTDRIEILTDDYPTVEWLEYLDSHRTWHNASIDLDGDQRVLNMAGLDWMAVRASVAVRDARGFYVYNGYLTAVPPLPRPAVEEMKRKNITAGLVSYGVMFLLIFIAFVGVKISDRIRPKENVYISEKELDKKLAKEYFYQ